MRDYENNNGTFANDAKMPDKKEIKNMIDYLEKVKLSEVTIPQGYIHKPLKWRWFEKFMNKLGWYRKFTAYVIDSDVLKPKYIMNPKMDFLKDPYPKGDSMDYEKMWGDI